MPGATPMPRRATTFLRPRASPPTPRPIRWSKGARGKMDCGQVTDGTAVVFLASPKRAAAYAAKRGIPIERLARISGWGHRNAPISYASKVAASAGGPYVFPQVQRAIEDARARAGVVGPAQLDAIETHDCFTATEYMAIDHLGLTPPGQSWQAIEDGSIELGGRLPINPAGGLIGAGHPVGATGVRMLLDGYKQVTGQAGDYQVDDARRVQTLNIGGSTTTTISIIVERGARAWGCCSACAHCGACGAAVTCCGGGASTGRTGATRRCSPGRRSTGAGVSPARRCRW